jgi:hypothetical protein
MPGDKSDVSNVSMMSPLHSDIARHDKNPIQRAKKAGAPELIGGPEETAA